MTQYGDTDCDCCAWTRTIIVLCCCPFYTAPLSVTACLLLGLLQLLHHCTFLILWSGTRQDDDDDIGQDETMTMDTHRGRHVTVQGTDDDTMTDTHNASYCIDLSLCFLIFLSPRLQIIPVLHTDMYWVLNPSSSFRLFIGLPCNRDLGVTINLVTKGL